MSKSLADNKKLTVINIFGGPGVGKSVTAAELFALMKKRGYSVELLHEMAKEYVWERWTHIFTEQDFITSQQHRQQRRLVDHDIQFAISDSPLLLGLFYAPPDYPESFKRFLEDINNTYNNINIFLMRSDQFEYDPVGRNQDLTAARSIDRQIIDYLVNAKVDGHSMRYENVVAGDTAAETILSAIETRYIKG